jgi:Mrp family chromosome partitioning ATPase
MQMSDKPANANPECVGTKSEQAGKAAGCAGCPNQNACSSGAMKEIDPALAVVADKLSAVKNKIIVLSGKGGVGKSTVASQVAFTLAQKGFSVGILDVDICGPSIPRMLGLTNAEVHQSGSGWTPILVDSLPEGGGELSVMSVGFMLPNKDDAVIWRGPRKNGLIKQFLTDVDWGSLDYLIVDTPPGTSDEHLSIIQYMRAAGIDGALIVSTPQEVAMADVRKEINFCKKTKVPVLGVVENMAGLRSPLAGLKFVDAAGADVTADTLAAIQSKAPELLNLSVQADVFPRSGGGPEEMASTFGVPFLGALPMDSNLTQSTENGKCFVSDFPESPALQPLLQVVDTMMENIKGLKKNASE